MDSTDRKTELLEIMKNKVMEVRSSEEWKAMLDMQSRFWTYSFYNQMLIVSQRPQACQVASLKAWNKLERSVTAGEKAIYVLGPSFISRKKAEQLAAKQGSQPEAFEGRIQGFHLCPVFDVGQTHGKELPTVAHPLQGEAPEGLFEKVSDFASSNGYNISFRSNMGAMKGMLDRDKGITLNAEVSGVQALKTLVHELAHGLLGHMADEEGRRDRHELEAESCAWIVCRALGVDTDSYSFGYLAVWLRDNDAEKALSEAGARAATIAKDILSGLAIA